MWETYTAHYKVGVHTPGIERNGQPEQGQAYRMGLRSFDEMIHAGFTCGSQQGKPVLKMRSAAGCPTMSVFGGAGGW